jgi:hypothetical protein
MVQCQEEHMAEQLEDTVSRTGRKQDGALSDTRTPDASYLSPSGDFRPVTLVAIRDGVSREITFPSLSAAGEYLIATKTIDPTAL